MKSCVPNTDFCAGVSTGNIYPSEDKYRIQIKSLNAAEDVGSTIFKLVYKQQGSFIKSYTNEDLYLGVKNYHYAVLSTSRYPWNVTESTIRNNNRCMTISKCYRTPAGYCSMNNLMPVESVSEIRYGTYVFMSDCRNGSVSQIFEAIYPPVGETFYPSTTPTISPSYSPSASPSTSPIPSPTLGPSTGPVIYPSVDPSVNPSIAPSTSPTITTIFATPTTSGIELLSILGVCILAALVLYVYRLKK